MFYLIILMELLIAATCVHASSCFDSGVVDTKDVGYSVPGFVVQGIDQSGNGLTSISGLGDINGDGFNDVAFQETLVGFNGIGTMFIFFGRNTSLPNSFVDLVNWNDTALVTVVYGGTNVGNKGFFANGIGDFNGDGIDEFVGSCLYCRCCGDLGMAYTVFGMKNMSNITAFVLSEYVESNANGTKGFGFGKVQTGQHFGQYCHGADVDGDGKSDLTCSNGLGAGVATLFGGLQPSIRWYAGWELDSDGASSGEGFQFTDTPFFGHAADIDDDGIADIFLDGYVLFGSSTWRKKRDWRLSEALLYVRYLTFSCSSCGWTHWVTGIGDFNGDGIDDALIEGSTQVYILLGGKQWRSLATIDISTANTSFVLMIQRPPGATLHYYADISADVNGDGIQDLLFGTQAFDILPHTIPLAYVVYGRKTDFQQSNWTTINPSDGFIIQGNWTRGGATISGVGDFNGDGADEIVVLPSRPEDGPGGEFDGGYAHLIYGCPPKSPLPTHTHSTTTTAATTTAATTLTMPLTTTDSSTTTSKTTSVSTVSQSTSTTMDSTTIGTTIATTKETTLSSIPTSQSQPTTDSTKKTETHPTTTPPDSSFNDTNTSTMPANNVVLSRPGFIVAVVACAIVLVIVLVLTVRGCKIWWRKHKRHLAKVPVVRLDIDNDPVDGHAITSGLQLQTRPSKGPSFERL